MKDKKWKKHPLFDACLISNALDPELIGPTFAPIPLITLPTGPTGVTGPTGFSNDFLFGILGTTSSALAVNSPVPFDTISTNSGTNISLDTGTGIISLSGIHIYLIIYSVGATPTNREFQLYYNSLPVAGTHIIATTNTDINYCSSAIINVSSVGSFPLEVRNLVANTTMRSDCCEITVITLV
ncbi:exosporium leader peptide-containing protein [Bacillus wiedmannii]|uniref:exosporium leader peptide-containing protein n=1 Tax=Bacillus wiedmannii TaxID=1890302 RepID=UPI00211D8178|nr:exosporium leader peptide-containing protein [Bacillus wiedmannii]